MVVGEEAQGSDVKGSTGIGVMIKTSDGNSRLAW
jgi:hypothetical protein